MTSGYVVFHLGAQTFATPLDDVREIVRLAGVERLPGTRPPVTGVVVLRGAPLPVLDVRAGPPATGDVLVLDGADGVVGVAVDHVVAIVSPDELPAVDAPTRSLPAYVVAVHSYADAPALVVDIHRLLDVAGTSGTAAPAAALG